MKPRPVDRMRRRWLAGFVPALVTVGTLAAQTSPSAKVLGSLELPAGFDRDAIGFWPQRPDLLLAQTREGVSLTSVSHLAASPEAAPKSLLRGAVPFLPSFAKWIQVSGAPGTRGPASTAYLFGLDSHQLYLEDARGVISSWDLDQLRDGDAFFEGAAAAKSLLSPAAPMKDAPGAKSWDRLPRVRLQLRGRGLQGRIVSVNPTGAVAAVLFEAARAGVPVYQFQAEPGGTRLLLDAGDGAFHLFDTADGTIEPVPDVEGATLGVSQWKWSANGGSLVGVFHQEAEAPTTKALGGGAADAAEETEEPVLAGSRLVRYGIDDRGARPLEFEGAPPAKAFNLLAANDTHALVEPLDPGGDASAPEEEDSAPLALVIALGGDVAPAAPKSFVRGAEDKVLPFGPALGW